MQLERSGPAVAAIAAVVFLGTIVSPPSLLDDVDATYAQIARTMLASGDWLTARVDGVPYFDKPPGQVWAIAASFAVFGVRDWAARIPMALASILLCWLTWRLGRWAFGAACGALAGAGLATCVGMFLFTRVRMPDVFVACTVLAALWAFLWALEERAAPRKAPAAAAGAAIGAGMMFKGLVAAALPVGAMAAYLAVSGAWRSADVRRRLRPGLAAAAALLVAAPWHLLAVLRHPPYFELTLVSEAGRYHGFFWRYFVNEHLLRYLGMRYPQDYDTVPLAAFWLGHLLWLFPWSAYAPALRGLAFGSADRAARTRLTMLCCCAFTLLFFSVSTSQEYYTLPAYAPVLLLLAGGAVRSERGLRLGGAIAGAVSALALAAALGVLLSVWNLPAEGGIASRLRSNPDAYTLSLGHMRDLTLASFAWLRGPLALACAALAVGAFGGLLLRGRRALAALVLMPAVLAHAARWAMVAFDPYLSSRPLAEAYLAAPPGELILDREYYAFSSLVFYANRPALLLNGRKNNIEYGSYAPGAPDVFLDDAEFAALWRGGRRLYLAAFEEDFPRLEKLAGARGLTVVARAGGKALLTNAPRGP